MELYYYIPALLALAFLGRLAVYTMNGRIQGTCEGVGMRKN